MLRPTQLESCVTRNFSLWHTAGTPDGHESARPVGGFLCRECVSVPGVCRQTGVA